MPKQGTKIGRRYGSILRDKEVHRIHGEILDSLGDLAPYVSKEYVYSKLHERTGLSTRTLSHILNHTRDS